MNPRKQREAIEFEFRGVVHTSLQAFAREHGMKYQTIYARWRKGLRGAALLAPTPRQRMGAP